MANRPELQGKVNRYPGISRTIRENKRTEAEIRNDASAPDKRRSFWRARGFVRQSQAASMIKGVVTLTNEQAKIHKQRSADWPMIKDELGSAVV